MAVKLKNAADRCKLLEKEDRVAHKDLEKVTTEAKDTHSAMRAMKEELRQAGDITAGKPYMLWMKFGDPKYAPLDRKWNAANTYLAWRRVPRTRPNTSVIRRTTKWISFFGRSSTI